MSEEIYFKTDLQKRLASILGTAPCNITDGFGICPQRIERFLERKTGRRIEDGVSLLDFMLQLNMVEAVQLIEKELDCGNQTTQTARPETGALIGSATKQEAGRTRSTTSTENETETGTLLSFGHDGDNAKSTRLVSD